MAKDIAADPGSIYLPRAKRHAELALRWLTCGWRLFRRNPWLLGGMGAACSSLFVGLTLIPLIAGPVIALLAPMFLASAYLAIDALTRQKTPLPPALRLVAVKQSPLELIGVFRNEDRIVPILLISLCSLTVALVVNALALLITGNAWAQPWAGLNIVALLAVLGASVAVLAIYFLLAASLVYALPLAFLQNEPLVPAIQRSFKASMHYVVALLVIATVVIAPSIVGALVSYSDFWLGCAARIAVAAVAWPIVAASLYCSYRTVFPPQPPVS